MHSQASHLFGRYFTFQQKSLQNGLYTKFWDSPALQQSNEYVHTCTSWCAMTQTLKVTAAPLEKGILVRKDLREEV